MQVMLFFLLWLWGNGARGFYTCCRSERNRSNKEFGQCGDSDRIYARYFNNPICSCSTWNILTGLHTAYFRATSQFMFLFPATILRIFLLVPGCYLSSVIIYNLWTTTRLLFESGPLFKMSVLVSCYYLQFLCYYPVTIWVPVTF
jgi:hypothetical protein